MANIKAKQTEEKKSLNLSKNKGFISGISVIIGLLIGAIVIVMMGSSVSSVLKEWTKGNFRSINEIGTFLGTMSWLLMLGLALIVSFRAGVFNIGAAGQATAAGIVVTSIGHKVHMGAIGPFVLILLGVTAGIAVAWIIGILKVKFGVHEVVSSIMLNWVIYYIFQYLPMTSTNWVILDSNSLRPDWIVNMFNGSASINTGVIFLLLSPILYIVYKFTTFGYKQDMIGSNPSVANYIGLKKDRELMKTFILSGALAGLAGVIFFAGQSRVPIENFKREIPGYLFNGIVISLVAAYSPLGALLPTFMIATLHVAKDSMNGVISGLPITDMILAIIVIIIALSNIFIYSDPFTKIKAWINTEEEKPKPKGDGK